MQHRDGLWIFNELEWGKLGFFLVCIFIVSTILGFVLGWLVFH